MYVGVDQTVRERSLSVANKLTHSLTYRLLTSHISRDPDVTINVVIVDRIDKKSRADSHQLSNMCNGAVIWQAVSVLFELFYS